MEAAQGFNPEVMARLKAKSDAFSAQQPKKRKQPTTGQWYEPIRILKNVALSRRDNQTFIELRSGVPNFDDLTKLRRLALAYGADGQRLGWI